MTGAHWRHIAVRSAGSDEKCRDLSRRPGGTRSTDAVVRKVPAPDLPTGRLTRTLATRRTYLSVSSLFRQSRENDGRRPPMTTAHAQVRRTLVGMAAAQHWPRPTTPRSTRDTGRSDQRTPSRRLRPGRRSLPRWAIIAAPDSSSLWESASRRARLFSA